MSKTRVGLPNHVLARATYENLELVGPPVFPEEAREFARAIQQGEGMDPMAEGHWGNNALGGFPAAIDPTWISAGRTVAATLVDLARDRDLLTAAKSEFRERTGGGVGGSTWVPTLLPRDFVPPVDLAWPEYVETARGREWHLPTPVTWGDPL